MPTRLSGVLDAKCGKREFQIFERDVDSPEGRVESYSASPAPANQEVRTTSNAQGERAHVEL